jgi:hypothetical protein
VHAPGLVTLHHVDGVAVSGEQGVKIGVGSSPQHRGARDLVAVEVEDREHRAVAGRVQEADALPASLQGAGLRLAIAHHGGHDEVGVVEGGAEGVGEDVAELAALVDGAGRRHAHVARDAARGGELPEEAAQARRVARDVRIDLRVRALEVDLRHDGRPAVPGTGEIDHVGVVPPDEPVQVDVDEALAR